MPGEQTTVVVALTRDEAEALLHAYEIVEFPATNPLGPGGEALLASAEAKLRESACNRDDDGERAAIGRGESSSSPGPDSSNERKEQSCVDSESGAESAADPSSPSGGGSGSCADATKRSCPTSPRAEASSPGPDREEER